MPLAWILEYRPTILLPGKGQIPFEPWEFQQDFLSCRDRFRAINKPRQCGISTTAAAEAAWEFDNIPGAQIVIISKDKDAAVNFHKYVRNILFSVRRNNPKAPKILKDNERETTNSLGNRIVSLAASKESGRSFSATHLYFDELAFVQYADEIWQAASATLAQTRGRVTAISTPKGRANLFARIFEQRDHLGFTIFSYAWWDVPTYNPYYAQYKAATTAVERKKWIELAKTGEWYLSERPKYTDLQWRQEFEGAFDANAGSVFSTRQIERVFKKNWLEEKEDAHGLLTMWYTSEREKHHDYAIGIDLGRKNDPTVVITYDYTTTPARMVDFKYVEAGLLDWKLIKRVLQEHIDYWDGESLHDGTGTGDYISDALESVSTPFIFSKNNKQGLVENVQLVMDRGEIRMPKIPVIYDEHRKYLWDDKDIVQDTVMANALAVSIFSENNDVKLGYEELNFVGDAPW